MLAWRGLDKPFRYNDLLFYWNRNPGDGMLRESILFACESPLNSYRSGGVFNVFMEEGQGLGSWKSREPHWDFKRERNSEATIRRQLQLNIRGANELPYFQPYGVHRLTTVHHGSNRVGHFDDDLLIGQMVVDRIYIPVRDD